MALKGLWLGPDGPPLTLTAWTSLETLLAIAVVHIRINSITDWSLVKRIDLTR